MDVVIVGAGIAGLSTARLLVAEGVSVVVLESRDRVGGRLLSAPIGPGGTRLDLGATWFWPGETRVAKLVEELGVPTHEQHLAGDAMYHDPAGPQRLDGNPIDVPSFRFSSGAQSLAEAIADSLPQGVVQLGTTVQRVSDSGRLDSGWLEVTHVGGTEQADHVVLALPPALAVSRIQFDPDLPDRLTGLASITPVWMGAVVKAVIHYDQPFWRQSGLSGSAISHLGPLREIHDMSGPDGAPAALFGFAPQQSDGPVPSEADVVGQLVEIFGSDAADPTEVLIADWRQPDTSPPGVERLNSHQAFGHEAYQNPALDGRLHWASTETARSTPGHIEGALEAAERVAAAIS